MEAGGCAKWAEGHPSPDPFYVDQVKGTLRQMDVANVFSACEMRFETNYLLLHSIINPLVLCRLQGPAIPSLAKASWFLNYTKESKHNESGIGSLVSLVRGQNSPKSTPPAPARKLSQPESILKKKPLPSPNLDLRRQSKLLFSVVHQF
jgi:hypothetical protein